MKLTMKKRLVLLTSQFPFGKGEEFLETETPYLTRYFDVDIVPLTENLDTSQMRTVSKNINVRKDINNIITSAGSNGYSRLFWLFRHDSQIFSKLIALIIYKIPSIIFKPRAVKRTIGMSVRAGIIQYALEKTYATEKISIFYSYWLLAGALALALRKQNNSNVVSIARAHRGDLYAHRATNHYLPMQDFIIQHLDRIVCISQDGSAYLKNLYPKSQDKISLSRLGVQQAPVVNQPSEDNRLRLVTCSYLVPVKRLSLLIEALAQCTFPITWTHLGGGDLEKTLRSQAEFLPKNIHWKITGILPNSEILHFYQQEPVDLFINVSSSEGLPVSIMEAMSYGIPVAATDVGGTSELVRHKYNGFLWDKDIAPEDIATTLEEFYAMSPSEKKAFRDRVWQTWHDKVNADEQYPEFTDWLVSLSNQ